MRILKSLFGKKAIRLLGKYFLLPFSPVRPFLADSWFSRAGWHINCSIAKFKTHFLRMIDFDKFLSTARWNHLFVTSTSSESLSLEDGFCMSALPLKNSATQFTMGLQNCVFDLNSCYRTFSSKLAIFHPRWPSHFLQLI